MPKEYLRRICDESVRAQKPVRVLRSINWDPRGVGNSNPRFTSDNAPFGNSRRSPGILVQQPVNVAMSLPHSRGTRNGRAAAVLVSHDEFESWKETTAIRSDSEFRDEIRKGIKALRARRAKTFRSKDLDRLFRAAR